MSIKFAIQIRVAFFEISVWLFYCGSRHSLELGPKFKSLGLGLKVRYKVHIVGAKFVLTSTVYHIDH